MNRICPLVLVVLCIFVVQPMSSAQDAPTIKLNFTAYDSMTVRDCLRVMSMETGDVILPDSSVNGFAGAVNVEKDSVSDMLDYLKTYEPGLTYQIVYYQNGPAEPDGEQLYQQVQELKSLTIPSVLIPTFGEDNTMITFKNEPYTTADVQTKAEAGLREIYLVSDPTVRAQMKSTTTAPNEVPTNDNMSSFNFTLQNLTQAIAKMNPRQQSIALAALATAGRQMKQSLAPLLAAENNGIAERSTGGHQTVPAH